jgi:hypothetical protein
MLRPRLAREIAAVLVIKVLLLAGIGWLFFGPERQVEVTPDAVHRLLAPAHRGTPAAS